MAGTIVADNIQAASTSTLVLKNGVANTPPTVQDSAGTEIGTFCRAWVNFDGTTNTGGFCTIRASFNVTSVADNSTGNYTVNFTTAMPDENYSAVATGSRTISAAEIITSVFSFSTTSCSVSSNDNASALTDANYVSVAIFR